MIEPWTTIILHADMDAFFAAVEQLDNPELRGLPVVMGSRSARSVVSTCSYEARVFGVHSAMPMVKALELCPQAVVVRPRMERYVEVSHIIMGVFEDFSPAVEPLSVDEAFIDMSGSTKIFGTPEQMARSVKDAVKEATGGLTISVGVASTKFVAKVASDMQKPDGLTMVPPGTELDFLHPLPLKKIWGVGPKTQERLEKKGLHTIGDVANYSRTALEETFGSSGAHMWQLANGIDEREVHPREEAKSVGREYTLAEDVCGLDEILPHLQRSADRIARTLRQDGVLAKGLRVKLKTTNFKLLTRQMALKRPTASAPELLEGARELLDKFDLLRKYRLVGMATFNFVPGEAQGDLFAPGEVKRQRSLDSAVDKVLDKFGDGALSRGSDLDRKK